MVIKYIIIYKFNRNSVKVRLHPRSQIVAESLHAKIEKKNKKEKGKKGKKDASQTIEKPIYIISP